MHPIAQFLTDSQTFYIATMDGDQPRVRPFGAVMEWEGKIYLCSNNQKDFYKQLMANPKVEISSMAGDKWIRLTGKLAVDSRREARAAMLEARPSLRNMYTEDDGLYEVMYFTEAKASICSFSGPPVEIAL